MYFFDLKSLIRHLKDQKNTPYETFQYMVGGIIVERASKFIELLVPKQTPALTGGVTMFGVFAAIFFTWIAIVILKNYFSINGGNSGKHFADRLIALLWVIGLRGAVFFGLPLALILILGTVFMQQGVLVVPLAVMALFFGWIIYVIAQINTAFKQVNSETASHVGDPL